MGRDEQVEEREVLDAIFPEEITDIDDTHFRVAIALDIEGQNGGHDDDEEEAKPTILLSVSYPAAYPDVGPDLDLSHAPNAAKPDDLDLSEDKAALLAALEAPIEESLGMAMVFTLVTSVKEAAEQLIGERRAAAEQVQEARRRAEEEKEDAKFHGEKVTRDSFLAWRARFVAEKEELDKKRVEEADAAARKGGKVAAPIAKDDKLTGRQLWEKGLAGKGWEEEEGDGAAMQELDKKAEGLKVDG